MKSKTVDGKIKSAFSDKCSCIKPQFLKECENVVVRLRCRSQSFSLCDHMDNNILRLVSIRSELVVYLCSFAFPPFVRSTSRNNYRKKLAFFQHFRFHDCKSWSLKLFSIPQHKALHVYDVKRALFGRKLDIDGFYICIRMPKISGLNLSSESTIKFTVRYSKRETRVSSCFRAG